MPKSLLVRKPAVAFAACVAAAALAIPATASAASSGGIDPGAPEVEGGKAKLMANGQARPPANAPQKVKDAIAAANSIDDAGYCMGGGHKGNCYDCSGTLSYVLGPKGAGLLKSPLDSTGFKRWGERGLGNWITVYTNSGHAMIVIAGLRFDTSQPDDGDDGPGWSKDVKAGMVNGPFAKRHWEGL